MEPFAAFVDVSENNSCMNCDQVYQGIKVGMQGSKTARVRPVPAPEKIQGVRSFNLCDYHKRGMCNGNCIYAHSLIEKAFWEGGNGTKTSQPQQVQSTHEVHAEKILQFLTKSDFRLLHVDPAYAWPLYPAVLNHIDRTLSENVRSVAFNISRLRVSLNQDKDLSLPRTIKLHSLKSYLASFPEISIAQEHLVDGTQIWKVKYEPVSVSAPPGFEVSSEEVDGLSRKHDIKGPVDHHAISVWGMYDTPEIQKNTNESPDANTKPDSDCQVREQISEELQSSKQENFKLLACIHELESQVSELKELQEASLCQICMEHPRNVIILPCCHFHYCAKCMATVQESQKACPYCRGHIAGLLECKINS